MNKEDVGFIEKGKENVQTEEAAYASVWRLEVARCILGAQFGLGRMGSGWRREQILLLLGRGWWCAENQLVRGRVW